MENVAASLNSFLKRYQKKNLEAYQAVEQAFKDPEVEKFIVAHADELASDFFDKSAAKIFEFTKQKKLKAMGQPTLVPGYIPELQLEQGYVVVSYRPTEEALRVDKIRRRQARIRAINMPKMIRNASFDDLEVDTLRQPIVEQIITWLQDYTQNPNDYYQGMYLYGDYGVGKTYLIGALANELAECGVEVTMVHFPTFAVEMRNSIGNSNVDTLDQIQLIKTSEILIIDDIGAESMSAWIRDDILGVILDYRMQNELPTFFTSNFSMYQLEKEHLAETRQALEPVKAERLMQRVKFLAKEYLMNGANRRLGN